MATKEKKQKRIWVTNEITSTLQIEFNVTGVAVLNALKFYSFSENALNIRKRALELMALTQKNNQDLYKQFNK